MSGAMDAFVAHHDELEMRIGRRRGWAYELRRAGLERFTALGFPSTRLETWRHTPVGALLETPFAMAPDVEGAGAARRLLGTERLSGFELVFVNGHFDRQLSSRVALPAATTVESLADVLQMWPGVPEPHLGRYADFDANAFTALNTAFLEDGVYVHVPKRTHVETPLVFRYVSTPSRQPTASHPRGLLVLDPYSRATVVEHFTGGGHYLTNAVTEIVLGEGARLDYCLVVSEGEESFHVGRVRVEHGPGSHFNASTVTFGGALCRTEIHDRLGAEGAQCVLNGLYLGSGRQHVDNLTRVEHVSPRCTSRELYKGILDGRSTGVFSGQLRVEEDARRSDATQLNQNLVLSGAATVDTLPHLDLLADDVRCAHAAEVEPLDEDRLFYLRSRGVPEGEARSLLTRAFASEVLEHIQPAAWRDHVRAKVEAALPGGSAWSPPT